eukprot:CAMPEP_0184687970 /NCGR_PEP_ID=MMETSP0312-20130426/28120_1 /TAXON_ID=31354 /ORGANISM="Compsopogon coeruleus, Strain SAG 36.94" /LENGTH=77 /DNA_ID=CAMNT_0027144625 /DNA_START=4029 /DNA_END=4260 /DNA_ORIENTATION=-
MTRTRGDSVGELVRLCASPTRPVKASPYPLGGQKYANVKGRQGAKPNYHSLPPREAQLEDAEVRLPKGVSSGSSNWM